MITYSEVIGSEAFVTARVFSQYEKPIYARYSDGSLHPIDAVVEDQLVTNAGLHDIIVFIVAEDTAKNGGE